MTPIASLTRTIHFPAGVRRTRITLLSTVSPSDSSIAPHHVVFDANRFPKASKCTASTSVSRTSDLDQIRLILGPGTVILIRVNDLNACLT